MQPSSSAAVFTATPTALVVDDDPVASGRFSLLLSQLGVQALCCASVAEGLTALQADIAEHGCVSFTRIFCDIVMPDASGDVLLGLLASSGWPCSIVMVTGSATDAERRKCEALGATSVLSKPVRKSLLAEYFTADAIRDGRRMLGRPTNSLRRVTSSSKLADALLVPPLERKTASGCFALAQRQRSLPSWTMPTSVDELRAISAPHLFSTRTSRAPKHELDWSQTPAAVHALAMGAALALVTHIEAADCGRAKGPVGQAAEDARLFDEERAAGEAAPSATPARIYRFLMVLIINNRLDTAVAIEAVIFLERAARHSALRICHANWKSLLLTAIILASKAHYDERVYVEDFVRTLRMYHLSAPELHRLEVALLRLMDYGALVRHSTFTLYSVELVALHHAACPFCAARPAPAAKRDAAATAAAMPVCHFYSDGGAIAMSRVAGCASAASAAAAGLPTPPAVVSSKMANCANAASAIAAGLPLPPAIVSSARGCARGRSAELAGASQRAGGGPKPRGGKAHSPTRPRPRAGQDAPAQPSAEALHGREVTPVRPKAKPPSRLAAIARDFTGRFSAALGAARR